MNQYRYLKPHLNDIYKCEFVSGHIVFTKHASLLRQVIQEELSFEELKRKFGHMVRIVFPNEVA